MEIRKQIEQLIATGQTKEAIQALKEATLSRSALRKDLLLLEAQFNRLEKTIRTNTEGSEKLRLEENRISQSLIRICEEVFQKEDKPNKTENRRLSPKEVIYAIQYTLVRIFQKPSQNEWFWILLAAVILLIVFPTPPEWIGINESASAQWTKFRSPLLGSLIVLMSWLLAAKVVELLRYNLKQKRLNITDSVQSPIKGLRHFDFEDAAIFRSLQRTNDIEICLTGILQSDFRFGILSGESGCGKTSFVRAGLHAALEETKLSCVVAKLTNEPPLSSIRKALSQQLPGIEGNSQYNDLLSLMTFALSKTLNGRLTLILDQFEQFFTHQKTAGERIEFIEHLKMCYTQLPQLKVLISLRRDFAGRMHEIQINLDYLLRARYNYFDLEKFTPQQAAAIFQVMAEAETITYDEDFVQQMCQEDLASTEDGLISAVDIQILAFIIKGQRSSDKAFNRTAFQRMGGIDGLLQRFLQEQLETPNYYNTDQAALKVLLAFIDLDNNVRAGELTREQLNQKLADSHLTPLLSTILNWLEGLRLVTKTITGNNQPAYELAHERLILPLNNLAGRNLGEVEQANQILNKRTNEWLVNDRKVRFLPSWQEYRLIQQQAKRQLLRWGKNKKWKEMLLQATWRKFVLQFLAITVTIIVLGGGLIIQQSNWYIFNYKVRNTLDDLIIGYLNTSEQEKIVPKLVVFNFDFIANINNKGVKDRTYAQIVSGLTNNQYITSSKSVSKTALSIANQIEDPNIQSTAFRSIALAAAKMGDTIQAQSYLRQSTQAAGQIQNFKVQSNTLLTIARQTVQMGDTALAQHFLKQITLVAGQIGDMRMQAEALDNIAQQTAQMGDTTQAQACLQQALQAVTQVTAPETRANSIKQIVQTATQIGDQKSLAQAILMVNQLEDFPLQANSLCAIAQSMANVRDTVLAQSYLQKAIQAAIQTSPEALKVKPFLQIVQTATKISDRKSLTQIFLMIKQIQDTRVQADVLLSLARSSAQMGDTIQARTCLREAMRVAMIPPADITKSLQQIGQIAGQIRDRETMKKIVVMANQRPEYGFQFNTIRSLVQSAAQIGDTTLAITYLKQVIMFIGKMKEDDTKSTILDQIAQSAVHIRDRESLQKTMQAARQIEDPRAQSDALGHLAKYFGQMGDTIQAQQCLLQALDQIIHINEVRFQNAALRSILQTARQIQDRESLKQSMLVVGRIEDANSQSTILSYIAQITSQMGDTIQARTCLQQALQAAIQIEEVKSQTAALRTIAQTAAQIDDPESLKQTALVISKMDNGYLQAESLRAIVQSAAQMSDQALLNAMEVFVPLINGLENQAVPLELLVTAYLQIGQYRKAYQIADGISLSNAKLKALAYLNLMKGWKEKEKFKPVYIQW